MDTVGWSGVPHGVPESPGGGAAAFSLRQTEMTARQLREGSPAAAAMLVQRPNTKFGCSQLNRTIEPAPLLRLAVICND
jgi:hypothetical protein